jgi:hypothetical protein
LADHAAFWTVYLSSCIFICGRRTHVVPARFPELIKNPKSMQAMLKMTKLDIAELERAVEDQGVTTYR